MSDTVEVSCITCAEPLEVPAEHADDGPFKHPDCEPPVGV